MALSLIGCEKEGGYTAEPESISPLQTKNFIGVTSYTAIVAGQVNVSVSETQDTLGIMYSDNKDSLLAHYGISEVAAFFNGKEFELELKGLQPKTTYYYCAWLTQNGKPTMYGEIQQFTTLDEGSVKSIGEFSVADDKKITFSQGNLQYRPTTKTWYFAKNQWEYLGEANANIGPSYMGWIDLFGWGTGDAAAKLSTNNSDYEQFVAWGDETISGESNTWRTLNADEWDYLLYSRSNADSLYESAIVNKQNGIVIYPDGWSYYYAGLMGWDMHTYSTSEWKELESRGAIFLPAIGSRQGWVLNSIQNYGRYWTDTEYSTEKAYAFCFYDYGLHMGGYDRFLGLSVRLVKDLQ